MRPRLRWYLRQHFKQARKKRAGGNPTGMTPWMFGAMTGRITEDGVWEWYSPSGASGESNAI